ncbi:MAG: monovalent cation/H+ antiporter subunit D family protein, partial [Gammaproteobacteria bacterium]
MIAARTMELAVALPAAASIPIALTGRFPNLRETVTLITALVVFVLVASAVPGVLAGDRPELTLTEFLPGLALQFRLEPLGMIFALVASFLWLITSIYSIGYMRGHDEQHQTRFYVCFALAIASALGVAFAGNMLTLFAAYEVLSIS